MTKKTIMEGGPKRRIIRNRNNNVGLGISLLNGEGGGNALDPGKKEFRAEDKPALPAFLISWLGAKTDRFLLSLKLQPVILIL